LIALFDKSDKYHAQVLVFLQNYTGRLTTTWAVITETLIRNDYMDNVLLQIGYEEDLL